MSRMNCANAGLSVSISSNSPAVKRGGVATGGSQHATAAKLAASTISDPAWTFLSILFSQVLWTSSAVTEVREGSLSRSNSPIKGSNTEARAYISASRYWYPSDVDIVLDGNEDCWPGLA